MSDRAMSRLRAAAPRSAHTAPPPFEQLVARWPDDALERPTPAAARTARRRRAGATSGLLAIGVAGMSAGAALTAATGDPLGRRTDVVPAAASATVSLAKVTAVDPAGGLPWTVRAGRSTDGLWCLGVGQVEAGRRFGLTGLDGVFRPQPPAADDDCAVLQNDGARVIAQARTFVGGRGVPAVSVVYGITTLRDEPAFVSYPDGQRLRLKLDDRGIFVVARRGTLSETSPRLWFQGSDAHGSFVSNAFVDFGGRWAVSGPGGPNGKPFDPTQPVEGKWLK